MTTTMLTPEQAFDMYRHLVEENEQALPMLAWTNQDDETTIIGLAAEFPEGWGMQQVLYEVIEQMKPKLGRPAALVFSSEGWMKKAVPEEEWDDMDTSPGAFQREVDAGAKLAEAVTITGVSWDVSWSLLAGFERAEDGTVAWDEPMQTPAVGGIPDVLRDAILIP